MQVEDISVDVQSEAAFGVLGVAARAALPFVERALTENASIDLKPIAENARKSIEAMIAEFQRSTKGVRVDADVTDLRLGSIEFDSKTLRVIAEADGAVRIAITELPALPPQQGGEQVAPCAAAHPATLRRADAAFRADVVWRFLRCGLGLTG